MDAPREKNVADPGWTERRRRSLAAPANIEMAYNAAPTPRAEE
jgi:hypothetical protein